MSRKTLMTLAICALLTGCTDTSSTDTENVTSRTSTVAYVCIGMETSARFGACPGCKLDSDRMNSLFSSTFGYSGVLLQSEQATRSAVAKAINSAVTSVPEDGLFILYYSGHGGQEDLDTDSTEEPDGADSEDEYLCLYDSYLLDDEIWKLISKCKGRVFLCIDACHSQTMYRSVSYDISLEKGLAVPLEIPMTKSSGFKMKSRASALGEGSLRMLCWSGCMEAEYSFGSKRGGVMTNAILSRWSSGITYDSLWTSVKSDVTKAQPSQHPCVTKIGAGFNEAFR